MCAGAGFIRDSCGVVGWLADNKSAREVVETSDSFELRILMSQFLTDYKPSSTPNNPTKKKCRSLPYICLVSEKYCITAIDTYAQRERNNRPKAFFLVLLYFLTLGRLLLQRRKRRKPCRGRLREFKTGLEQDFPNFLREEYRRGRLEAVVCLGKRSFGLRKRME